MVRLEADTTEMLSALEDARAGLLAIHTDNPSLLSAFYTPQLVKDRLTALVDCPETLTRIGQAHGKLVRLLPAGIATPNYLLTLLQYEVGDLLANRGIGWVTVDVLYRLLGAMYDAGDVLRFEAVHIKARFEEH